MSEEDRDVARELYDSGRAALKAGDYDTAIRCLNESLEAELFSVPHFKTLELLGEAWLAKGEPRRAIVPLAAATTLNGQVRAPSLLAEALLAVGAKLQAHRVALDALDREPQNKRALAVAAATRSVFEAWNGE